MIPYHRVAELLWNSPLLLTPEKANTIAAFLLTRIDEKQSGRVSRFAADAAKDDTTGKQKPYMMTTGGTAIIPIIGELVNRGAWIGASSGLVSYEGLQHQIAQAIGDPKVKEIVLDISSPGGEAAGAFETASFIRDAAQVKPIIGYVNAMAASGGYALASACSKIVAVPSASVGSIGVYYMHMDVSQSLQKDGIKPTLIFAGAHKVDGNPFEALPNSVRADIQARIDKTYAMFVDTVAQGRRGMTSDAIRGTEARIYNGAEAASLGLIDAVGSLDQVLVAIGEARKAKSDKYSSASSGVRSAQVAASQNQLSTEAESHANTKIASGDVDRSASWSFSTEDEDAMLGNPPDWKEYGLWHLGRVTGADEKTKGAYKYPYGKGGKVFRSGVIAAKSRAAQNGDDSIASAADRLLQKIDKKKTGADAASQEETDSMSLKEQISAAFSNIKAAITGDEPKVEAPKVDIGSSCDCCSDGDCTDCSTLDGNSCSCHADCPGCTADGCGGLAAAAQSENKTQTEDAMDLTTEQKLAIENAPKLAAEVETLRAEIAKRDADAKAAAEVQAAELDRERKARIQTDADAFVTKCAHIGKDATDALRAEFISAKESGDTDRVVRLETIAASYAAMPVERAEKDGPSAEEIAKRVKLTAENIGLVAATNLKDRGVRQNSKEWTRAYQAEIAKLRAEINGGNSAAA